MTMESDGERLDEVFESPPDETQDWYFDLPQGAWERQEEKNRNLRQTLLNKQAQQQPQRKQEPEAKGGEKKRRWFGGGKDEQAPEEAIETPRFSKLSEETREERRARLEALATNAEEASTTAESDVEPASGPLLRRSRSEDEKASFAAAPDPDAPISRWDAMFGSGLQEGSIVDSMREWASGSKADAEDPAPAEPPTVLDADADDSEWDQINKDADESSMLEVLRRRRHAASMEAERTDDAPMGEAAASALSELQADDDEPEDDSSDDFEADASDWAPVAPEPSIDELLVAEAAEAAAADAPAFEMPEVDAAVPDAEDVMANAEAHAEAGVEVEDVMANAEAEVVTDAEAMMANANANANAEVDVEVEDVMANANAEPIADINDDDADDDVAPSAWEIDDDDDEVEDVSVTATDADDMDGDDEPEPFEAIASNLIIWPTTPTTGFEQPVVVDKTTAGHFDEAMSASEEFDESETEDEPAEKKPGIFKRIFGRGRHEEPGEAEEFASDGEWVPVEQEPLNLRSVTQANEWEPEEAPLVPEPAKAEFVESSDVDSPFKVMDESGWMPVTAAGEGRKELDTSWMAPAGSAARDAAAWSPPSSEPETPETEEYDEEDPWAPFGQADVENAQEIPGSAALAEEDDDAWAPAAFAAPVDDTPEEHAPADDAPTAAEWVAPAFEMPEDNAEELPETAARAWWEPANVVASVEVPSNDDVEIPDDDVTAEPIEAAFPPAADTVELAPAPAFDALSALPASEAEPEDSEPEASNDDGWAGWGDDAAFASAFEIDPKTGSSTEENSVPPADETVEPEATPLVQMSAFRETAEEPEADDQWDFAAALGRDDDESSDLEPVSEQGSELQAAPVPAFDMAALDASDAVVALAEESVPQDEGAAGSDEFDFDAALRTAEDRVAATGEAPAPVEESAAAWSLAASEEPDFEAALSGEPEPWPAVGGFSMATDAASAETDADADGSEELDATGPATWTTPVADNSQPTGEDDWGSEATAAGDWSPEPMPVPEMPVADNTGTTEDAAEAEEEHGWDNADAPAAIWAASLEAPGTGWSPEPMPVPEMPAAVEGENPWASLHDDDEDVPSEDERDVPQTEADEDADAWAAIANASGYNAEEEFEPPTFGKIARSPRDDERGSWLADNFPQQDPIPDPVDEAFAEHDEEDMERDLVLRAFEAHAATEVDDEPLEPGAFHELFGAAAQGIVDDLIEPQEAQSFAKMRMAPQRTSAPGSAPFEDEDDWIEGTEDDDGDEFDFFEHRELERAAFLAGSLKTQDLAEAKKTRTWVRELVETGLLALLVFLSVRASFQNFKVDGSSMYPTLTDGQFLIVNKLVYSEVNVDKLGKYVPLVDGGDDPTKHVFHGPERGDIIVLRDPSTPEQDLIKRVIGLPGEKIEVYEGAVYINDQKLNEPYLKDAWGRNGQGNYPAVIIPADSYFVMGDNRDNSKDSRSSQIGFIAEDLIIGRAEFTYLPLSAFGLIGNGGSSLSEQDGRPHLTSELRPAEDLAAVATR